jgi:threonine/homoserine/homoserine lactone efflux protein
MIHYLIIGIILGLSAGVAPGPLLALVISETLQHGIKAGVKVALSPIITDLPIVVVSLYALSRLSDYSSILGIISLFGSAFVFFIAFQAMFTRDVVIDIAAARNKSLLKGVLTNSLSPHPYMFWLTVGAPTMTKAMDVNIIVATAFIAGFYSFLVGSKIVLAVLVGKSKHLFSGNGYTFTMRFLGLALCLFAVLLLADGLRLLGIL